LEVIYKRAFLVLDKVTFNKKCTSVKLVEVDGPVENNELVNLESHLNLKVALANVFVL